MNSVNTGGLFATGLLLPATGILSVSIRYAARNRKQYGFEMDDFLCVPAGLMLIACGIIVMVGAGQGVLSPAGVSQDLPSNDIRVQQMGIAFDILQTFCLACIKVSAIFLYRRLFPGRGFNLACHFVAGFIAQWFLSFIVSILVFGIRRLQHPHENPSDFTANNSFVNGLLIILSVESIIVNIALYLLPITVLSKLSLPLRKVFKIMAIFLIAAMAILFGILQLTLPIAAQNDPEASALDLVTGIAGAEDIGAVSTYLFWGMLQMGFLLMVICLPTFGPFTDTALISWPGRATTGVNKPLPKLPKRAQRGLTADKHERRPSEMSDHILTNSLVGQGLRRPSATGRGAYGMSAGPHVRHLSDVSPQMRQPVSSTYQNYTPQSAYIPYHSTNLNTPYAPPKSHTSPQIPRTLMLSPHNTSPLAPQPLFNQSPIQQDHMRQTSAESQRPRLPLRINAVPPLANDRGYYTPDSSRHSIYSPRPTAYGSHANSPSRSAYGTPLTSTPLTLGPAAYATVPQPVEVSGPAADDMGSSSAPRTHTRKHSGPLSSNPNPYFSPSSASPNTRRASERDERGGPAPDMALNYPRRPSAALVPPTAPRARHHTRAISAPDADVRRMSDMDITAPSTLAPAPGYVRKTSTPNMRSAHARHMHMHSYSAHARRPSESLLSPGALPMRNMSVPDAIVAREIASLAPQQGRVEARVSPLGPPPAAASWFRDVELMPRQEEREERRLVARDVPQGSIMVQQGIEQRVEMV